MTLSVYNVHGGGKKHQRHIVCSETNYCVGFPYVLVIYCTRGP